MKENNSLNFIETYKDSFSTAQMLISLNWIV